MLLLQLFIILGFALYCSEAQVNSQTSKINMTELINSFCQDVHNHIMSQELTLELQLIFDCLSDEPSDKKQYCPKTKAELENKIVNVTELFYMLDIYCENSNFSVRNKTEEWVNALTRAKMEYGEVLLSAFQGIKV